MGDEKMEEVWIPKIHGICYAIAGSVAGRGQRRPGKPPFPTMATITKRELVIKLSTETGLTQQQVFDVIQRTLDSITDALANGDSVVMRKFGIFQVKETKAKIGRNPKDPGRDVMIPPRATVKFKPGKEMKEKVAQVLPKLREQETA